jgi:hypothetical protein
MHKWKRLYTIFENFVEKSQTLQIKAFRFVEKAVGKNRTKCEDVSSLYFKKT